MKVPWTSRVLRRLSWFGAWVFAKIWLRARFVDWQNVPRQGPLLLVGNHQSFLDPPLMGTGAARWVTFVARSTLERFPPMAWWLRHMGTLQIDRKAPSKEVLRTLLGALEQGHCIGLFPEGTRSRDGRVGPFRGGLEFILRRSGATVVPVGLAGSFAALPRGARWPRPRRCTVRYGAPMTAAEVLEPGGLERLRAATAALAETEVAAEAAAGDHGRVGTGRSEAPADGSHSAEDSGAAAADRLAGSTSGSTRLGQAGGPSADEDPDRTGPDSASGAS